MRGQKLIALKFLPGHVEGHTKLSVGIRPLNNVITRARSGQKTTRGPLGALRFATPLRRDNGIHVANLCRFVPLMDRATSMPLWPEKLCSVVPSKGGLIKYTHMSVCRRQQYITSSYSLHFNEQISVSFYLHQIFLLIMATSKDHIITETNLLGKDLERALRFSIWRLGGELLNKHFRQL